MKYILTVYWRPHLGIIKDNPFQTEIDNVPHFNTDNDAIRWSVNGVDSVYHWGDIDSFVVTPIIQRCELIESKTSIQCKKPQGHTDLHDFTTHNFIQSRFKTCPGSSSLAHFYCESCKKCSFTECTNFGCNASSWNR